MNLKEKIVSNIMKQCGGVIDIKEHPKILDDIIREVNAHSNVEQKPVEATVPSRPPFDISWMDSWVAHKIFADKLEAAEAKDKEIASVLRGMADLKLNARIHEIKSILRGGASEPPDGGVPEPSVPPAPEPAGPAIFSSPDGGVPEPGLPPTGPAISPGVFSPAPDGGPPDAGPPEPGVPPEPTPNPAPIGPDAGPPEPGVPPDPTPNPGPTGLDAGSGAFSENPWILYWFVSLKTPQLLDVIDLHISRRLDELRR